MDKHPICFRFPRGNGVGVDLAAAGITGFKGVPMEVRLVSAYGTLGTLGDRHMRGGQCTTQGLRHGYCMAYPPTACRWRGSADIICIACRRRLERVCCVGRAAMWRSLDTAPWSRCGTAVRRRHWSGTAGSSLLAVQAVGRLLLLFCKLHSQVCAKSVEQPHSVVVHMQTCMAAAEQLAKSGIEATVMDARFCKPLDESLIRQLAQKHSVRIVLPMPRLWFLSS